MYQNIHIVIAVHGMILRQKQLAQDVSTVILLIQHWMSQDTYIPTHAANYTVLMCDQLVHTMCLNT